MTNLKFALFFIFTLSVMAACGPNTVLPDATGRVCVPDALIAGQTCQLAGCDADSSAYFCSADARGQECRLYPGRTCVAPSATCLGGGTECVVGVGGCAHHGVSSCPVGSTVASLCSAVAGTPIPEICADAIDNDCNGVIDNGCTTICSPSGVEICDNLDNNCASGTDEGCDDDDDNYCDAGMTKAAGVTVTTCSATAVGASVGDDCDDACTSCMPGGKETCDNKDNDCSGVVDDHMTLIDSSCLHLGQCGAGVLFACVSASQTWTCDYSGVAAYEATEETTCDGLDNDCDGATDFEFSYLDGAVSKHIGAVCGLGICADQVVCNGAKSAAVCPKASLAVPENCANNLDDDCDGVVNNGCP